MDTRVTEIDQRLRDHYLWSGSILAMSMQHGALTYEKLKKRVAALDQYEALEGGLPDGESELRDLIRLEVERWEDSWSFDHLPV